MIRFEVLLLFVLSIPGCDPNPQAPPLTCDEDSIFQLDGTVFSGYITLCNGQGADLIYKPGLSTIEVQGDLIIFNVQSATPDFAFNFSDTTRYQCIIKEEMYRDFRLTDLIDSSYQGNIQETQGSIHLIIKHPTCLNSSFFEGEF